MTGASPREAAQGQRRRGSGAAAPPGGPGAQLVFSYSMRGADIGSLAVDALDAATLAERHPDVFGGEHASYFTLEKFTWARFIVWSRAIDLNLGKGGSEEDAFRVLVPFLDMANHAPSGKLHPRWDANANAVKVYAASEFRENTELRFNYGDKPSQYFLLQYGFLPERNPSDCVEATVRVDERDSLREQKERLLLRHGLDPRTRNFQWKHVGLDYDLIAATRIVMMDES